MAKKSIDTLENIVLIGGSAGSLTILLQALPKLNTTISIPIVIILHRKPSNNPALASLLATKTPLPVKEIEEKEPIRRGIIYTAPADYHLLFERDHVFSLDFSEKVNFSRPSIDVAFESAAEVFGASLTCILLSGASADGVEGLKAVKKQGGTIAVQDPATADMPFMPQQALLAMKVDMVINADTLGNYINKLGKKD